MKRRLFALALALLLAVSLPVSALAATWYLEDGDITIRATENGQYVSQGDKHDVKDDDPTIRRTTAAHRPATRSRSTRKKTQRPTSHWTG